MYVWQEHEPPSPTQQKMTSPAIACVAFFTCTMIVIVVFMIKLVSTESSTETAVQPCSADSCLSVGSTPSGDTCTVSCRSSDWEPLQDGRIICVEKDMSGPNLCTTLYPVQGYCSWESSLQTRAICSVGTILAAN